MLKTRGGSGVGLGVSVASGTVVDGKDPSSVPPIEVGLIDAGVLVCETVRQDVKVPRINNNGIRNFLIIFL
jgi:hypothetical protein